MISLLNLIVFLSAFLLFQIELIVAKIFLPPFGGSYFVWGACVVFFQAALLAGYLFSHFILERVGIRRYRYVYSILFFLPLLGFPGHALASVVVHRNFPPVLDIFLHLLLSIGPVFFILSTVSVTLQNWVAASRLPQREQPYFLYAWSNIGSLGALLTYPFFFESHFDLTQQIQLWRWGYFLLIALVGGLVVGLPLMSAQKQAATESRPDIASALILRWLLLSAAGVVMFLGVTNVITNEIAPVPLLWIVPLSIYLSTFILNFQEPALCPAWIKDQIWLWVGLGILLHILMDMGALAFLGVWGFLIYCGLLFLVCMYCQHELYESRPQGRRGLTFFYAMISLGSFLGGVFVSWVVPLLSSTLVEFLLALCILSAALVVDKRLADDRDFYLRLLAVMWVMATQNYRGALVLVTVSVLYVIWRQFSEKPQPTYYLLLLVLYLGPWIQEHLMQRSLIYRHRNYYGIMKVVEDHRARYFVHGQTVHGAQYLDPSRRQEPLTYFHYSTPIGRIMQSDRFPFQHVGIIGLGAGALSAYAKEGTTFDFLELDPDVYKTAQKYFTYLRDSRGKIEYYWGDARLTLDQIPSKKYDIFIVDAFGSDAVPVHLLTTEAIKKYRQYIKEDGLLLFHFTNRYLRLEPVLARNALEEKAFVAFQENPTDESKIVMESSWFAMTWDARKYHLLIDDFHWQNVDAGQVKDIRPWTDQYSNIPPYIKF